MTKIIFMLFFLAFSVTAQKKKACIILGENEYETDISIPRFADQVFKNDFELSYVFSDEKDRNTLNDLDSIRDADIVILSVRRLALKPAQLKLIRNYVESGKPLVALRTSTHGFAYRSNQKAPAGAAFWPEFDKEILGCSYDGHFPSSEGTKVFVDPKNKGLAGGIKGFECRSWLYKVKPLAKDATVLFQGVTSDNDPQPVTWMRTNKFKGRVFCTMLGHKEDFMQKSFQMMLFKGVYWAAEIKPPKKMPEYKYYDDFLEPQFSWFTSHLDARKAGKAFPGNNLTARGLILKPGNDFYACFDTDLLRYSLIWKGKGVDLIAMAPGSYSVNKRGSKSPQGEKAIPKPLGTPLTALSPVPGIEVGSSTWKDPRSPSLDPDQICNGPIPRTKGYWNGILMSEKEPVLSYSIGKTEILEIMTSEKFSKDITAVVRRIKCVNSKENLYFHLGEYKDCEIATFKDFAFIKNNGRIIAFKVKSNSICSFSNKGAKLDLEAAPGKEVNISLLIWEGEEKMLEAFRKQEWQIPVFPDINRAAPNLWPGKETTRMLRSKSGGEILIDEVELPLLNLQHRNVRASGINFFKDGRAAVCTFDGDVWIVENLHKGGKDILWKRFASGLNEPQNLVIKDDKIYVFDRNGIIRLHDRNNNGEADFYENFCNLPIQTAESREFPMDIKLMPDGSFVIAKGGQRGLTVSPHSGTVIQISADGKSIKTIATGLREPYIGVDQDTGDIFASDQQGHWIPSSPFIVIKNGGYYGFKPKFVSDRRKPDEPATWIPHRISQSGASMIKVKSAKMAHLNNRIIYLDYTIPSINTVFYNRARPDQAVFMRLSDKFTTPLLKAAVNLLDGCLYLSGFKIWGTKAGRTSAILRVRPGKKSSIPKDIRYYKEGVLLSFHDKIRKDSLNPHLFQIERWNYLRSGNYGSGHFNAAGKKGQDRVGLSSVTLSNDSKSVFVAIPDMRQIMQMSLTWKMLTDDNRPLENSAYFSVNSLIGFDKTSDFPAIDLKASALPLKDESSKKPSLKIGKEVSIKMGCTACHSTGSEKEGKAGPPWQGMYNSQRTLINGTKVKADEKYLKESILNPAAKVVKDYAPAMLPYEGVLKDYEVDSLILYLKSLK